MKGPDRILVYGCEKIALVNDKPSNLKSRYGVRNWIQFTTGDYFRCEKCFKADVVVLMSTLWHFEVPNI